MLCSPTPIGVSEVPFVLPPNSTLRCLTFYCNNAIFGPLGVRIHRYNQWFLRICFNTCVAMLSSYSKSNAHGRATLRKLAFEMSLECDASFEDAFPGDEEDEDMWKEMNRALTELPELRQVSLHFMEPTEHNTPKSHYICAQMCFFGVADKLTVTFR